MNSSEASAGTSQKPFGLNMEIVIGVVVSLVAIASLFFSHKFPSTGLATDIGSARFPQIYACALLVLCAMLIGRNLLKGKQMPTEASAETAADREVPSYRRAFIGIASSVLALAAMSYLGYGLVTVCYLSFLMWLMGMRHKLWNPLLAVLITTTLYFTFSAGLNVPLPLGSLFE
jgi:putative tricarboxylic transport membrane protein